MAFYPQFTGFYAYPMHFANQDVYGMYPGTMDPNATMFYDNNNMGHHNFPKFNKPGFNNRKISQDSGISNYSSKSSRKISNTSTISNASITEEDNSAKVESDDEPEAPMEIPSDELCEEIVQQVEFYFSNANITKDKFLLKHVKRNKEGFVSVKLISSFKRVKHLSKDWRQVAYAVEKKSEKLEVNDLKTKVRRLEPLPEYDETTPSRTVVVLNLPIERPTIEAVAEMFKVAGDIVLVRIVRPGNPTPADVKPFVNKHAEMTGKVCALVEFEKTEFAHRAISQLNNEEEDKMKVMELTAPPPVKTGKKSEEKKKMSIIKPGSGQPLRRFSQGMLPAQMMLINAANESALSTAPRRKLSLVNNMKFSQTEEKNKKSASLNPDAPVFKMQQRRVSRPSPQHPATFLMEPAFGMMHPMQPFPGMMTRRQMEYAGMAMQNNAVRQPKGPATEKGKGFQKWCRSRMEPPRKTGSKAVPIVAPPPIQEETVNEVKNEDEEQKTVTPKVAVAPVVVTITEESGTSDDEESDQCHAIEKSR